MTLASSCQLTFPSWALTTSRLPACGSAFDDGAAAVREMAETAFRQIITDSDHMESQE